MKPLPIAEFRDPDGSDVLVQPCDDVRCQGIDANVFPKGEVLIMRYAHDGSQEPADIGGCTLEALDDVFPAEALGGPRRGETIVNLLEEQDRPLGEHRYPDPEEQLVDPRSLSPDEPEIRVEDFQATVVRLVDHYRSAHACHEDGHSWVGFCHCPGWGPENDRARDRLHTVVLIAHLSERIPTLPELIRAVRLFERRLKLVA